MEYQKIIKSLDNSPNQPSKFRKKNWVEIDHALRVTYSVSSPIRFKTLILKSSLCDYSDAYISVSGTIAIIGTEAGDDAKRTDKINKEAIFKYCAPFTNCISEINNAQADNARDINVVMAIYNLIKYCDNFSKNQEVYGNITEMNQL